MSRRTPKHSTRHHHDWDRWHNPVTDLVIGFCWTCRLDTIGRQWTTYDPYPGDQR